jgi:hypothetical protein
MVCVLAAIASQRFKDKLICYLVKHMIITIYETLYTDIMWSLSLCEIAQNVKIADASMRGRGLGMYLLLYLGEFKCYSGGKNVLKIHSSN